MHLTNYTVNKKSAKYAQNESNMMEAAEAASASAEENGKVCCVCVHEGRQTEWRSCCSRSGHTLGLKVFASYSFKHFTTLSMQSPKAHS